MDAERFDSWKEIASYLGVNVRTARRWEARRGLPVHSVPGSGRRVVYGYRSEIDAWMRGAEGRHAVVDQRPAGTSGLEIQTPEPAATRLGINDVRGHRSFRRYLVAGISAGSIVALAVLVLLGLISAKRPGAAASRRSSLPVLPQGVGHWISIRLINDQTTSVPAGFSQLLVVDSSRYASDEAANLQNIEFFDQYGKVLRHWLESGNSNLSTRTVYWVQLPDGIPAGGSTNVYLGFAGVVRNLLNGDAAGEAPSLSQVYAQYDNGARVFSQYSNFHGSSLPPGWYSGTTPGGEGEIRVNNGVFMSHTARGGGSAFVGSNWTVGDAIAEMNLLSQQTVNGQEMIMVCSASPTRFVWTPYSVGYQNMSGLEIENNNAGTPSVVARANPNPTQSAVIGFQGSNLFANYQLVAQAPTRICGGNYLAAAVNTGFLASFSFDWLRIRIPPPSGVMPSAIFDELK